MTEDVAYEYYEPVKAELMHAASLHNEETDDLDLKLLTNERSKTGS